MTELPLYVLAVCRIVTALVFATSFLGKVRDISTFERTISSFGVFPRRLSKAAARFFLASELAVVLLLMAGGLLLAPGFSLAALLLLLFCCALGSVLVRGIRTSCNCFGPAEKPVLPYDVVRNVGLSLCALGGLAVSIGPNKSQASLSVAAWAVLSVAVALFVTVCKGQRDVAAV